MTRTTRSRDERGVALLEFALCVPVVLTLVMGAIGCARLYDANIDQNFAVREAGAAASVRPIGGTIDPYLQWLAGRVRDPAYDVAATSTPAWDLCVAYVHPAGTAPGSDATRSLSMSSSDTTGTFADAPCYADDLTAADRRVQVRLRRPSSVNALFFTSNLTLTSRSTTTYAGA